MRATLLALALALPACDDTRFGKSGGEEGEGEGEDWCAVQEIFTDHCTSCHAGASAAGGLDLDTDPHAALVEQASSLYEGQTLVVPGDSASSLLYLKVSNQQGDNGSAMPMPSGLSEGQAATVAAWIDAGASTDCSSPSDTGSDGYHPAGFGSGDVHGLEAKLQEQECTDCHGADLTGSGEALSCDSCHEDGWRTDCTFCHGGTDDTSGAPPRDIDGETDRALNSFPQHRVHLTNTEYKVGFACETCHSVPTDVLTPGHIFVSDDTPAVAELDFSGGLSTAGTWDGATCSNLYCHGNGQGNNGEVSISESIDDCTSCHPHRDSGRSGWATMTGAHLKHLEEGEGFECGDCHKSVVDTWEPIRETSLHVDGAVSISLVSGMTWNASAKTCDGECHEETHSDRWWLEEDDDY